MAQASPDPVRVHGRNLDVTNAMRDYAAKKVGRSLKFFGGINQADVELAQESNPRQSAQRFRVEITARSAGQTVRATGGGGSIEQAIDGAADRFEVQIRRLGDRMTDRRRHGAAPGRGARRQPPPAPVDEAPEIVRTKQFVMKPMTPEDASMAMAELGHSFFFFLNSDTGLQSVLYRRRDGRLGLIEPR